MRFNEKARLDTGRVRDTGGGGRAAGLGGGMGRAGAGLLQMLFFRMGWKGRIALIVVIGLLFVLGRCAGFDPLGMGGSAGYSTARMADSQDTGRYDACRTGAVSYTHLTLPTNREV